MRIPDAVRTVVDTAPFAHLTTLNADGGPQVTVVWVDVGQQSHDVHARDGSFDSPPLSPGNTFAHTFTKAGKYPYYCVPHEGDGMFGEVDVVAP